MNINIYIIIGSTFPLSLDSEILFKIYSFESKENVLKKAYKLLKEKYCNFDDIDIEVYTLAEYIRNIEELKINNIQK
ncbi:hypothetical protein ACFHWD_03205 [Clostridium sp. MT-14]|uniref:hypothetical protein n=1 Tax=Clostridium sp. MT-14 TaxID=3348360 RepID=UPI0035F43F00